jgi:hypothetical protein
VRWYRRAWLVLALGLAWTLLRFPLTTQSQAICEGEYNSFTTACFLGQPDAHGVSISDTLTTVSQVRAYKIRVGPGPSAVHLYLGDLWYDLDIALWRDPPNEIELGRWNFVAESRTFEQRTIQLVRPEIIVERLEPDMYTLFVNVGDAGRFDPRRGFTLRVALGPPVCATQRDAAERYQLGLTYQPTEPTAFSLLSFNAFISPPYSDLFDFEWRVDGQAVPGGLRETMQLAVADLAPVPRGQHYVQVTAQGVREYPDPDPAYRHLPPVLSVECRFRTS